MEKSQEQMIENIQSITHSILSQISIENGQDIVAFIGPAKSGKSTLINSLLMKPLAKTMDANTEEMNIATGVKGVGLIIDNNESVVPQQYEKCPGTAYALVEFSGLGDMLGVELEISLALAYEKVLRAQKTVRFVLVVPISMIKSDMPMEFFKLLYNLVTLCPNILRSFCIVATKSDSTSITTCLKKAMAVKLAPDNKEIIQIAEAAKSVIKHILDSGNCFDFKAPNKEGRKNFILPNIKEIVNLIKDLEGIKIETHVPLSISEFSNMKILELYKEIDLKFENEMQNITQYSDLTPVLESKIENLANIIVKIKTPADFSRFIKEIKPNYYDNFPLVRNLKNLIYILMVMKKFQIRDYMYRVDEIYNEIKSFVLNYRSSQLEVGNPDPYPIPTPGSGSGGIPPYITYESKSEIFERNKATEQRISNDIKSISKYFEQYETANRLPVSQLEKLRYIKENLKRSSNIERFIKNVEESDFNNWSLVENLKELIGLQTIMKLNNIFGYWEKEDADLIAEKICTEIDFMVIKYTSNLSNREEKKGARIPEDKPGKKCNVM